MFKLTDALVRKLSPSRLDPMGLGQAAEISGDGKLGVIEDAPGRYVKMK